MALHDAYRNDVPAHPDYSGTWLYRCLKGFADYGITHPGIRCESQPATTINHKMIPLHGLRLCHGPEYLSFGLRSLAGGPICICWCSKPRTAVQCFSTVHRRGRTGFDNNLCMILRDVSQSTSLSIDNWGAAQLLAKNSQQRAFAIISSGNAFQIGP